MKTIKVSEAQGPVLNWLVAKCAGHSAYKKHTGLYAKGTGKLNYSTEWSQGGPLMERDLICVVKWDDNTRQFHAECHKPYANPAPTSGPTQLIAAMRCYVVSKLGDEVEVPEELL